jgi:tRNA (uracil-5-)-methyltransferase
MKKNQIIEVFIESNTFPLIGIGTYEGHKIHVKNAIKGQKCLVKLIRKKDNVFSADLIEIIEKAKNEVEPKCPNFNVCGGCTLQNLSYEDQLSLKESMVFELFNENKIDIGYYDGKYNHSVFEYRNKMEYTFGNNTKDGPTNLGFHKYKRFIDVINTDNCNIAHKDFDIIRKGSLEFLTSKGLPHYNKFFHSGYLRHLLIRRSQTTGEILIGISTTSQMNYDLMEYVNYLLSIDKLEGNIAGIVHILNDTMSDAINPQEQTLLYGSDYIFENINNLTFKVTLFSFFQTNSLGAQDLYNKAFEYIGDLNGKVFFDLFSGTGTIGQIGAIKGAYKVIGIELNPDASNSAIENAKINNLDNCNFIQGDVFQVLNNLEDKPQAVIVDPPRAGLGKNTVNKLIGYNLDEIIYISCNPKTLVDDLKIFIGSDYKVEKLSIFDQFSNTSHVETVVLLSHKKSQASSPSL